MRYSNTAITQLTRWYKQILIKCALFNAALFTFGAVVATPANATEYTTQQVLTQDTTYTAGDSFVGSTSPAGNYGGAIENTGHNLTINGSSFTGNYLNTGAASDARGGAIYQAGGELLINNASFVDNYTIRNLGGRAGAINTANATTTISNSVFQNNSTRTSTGEGWVYGGMGAAIYQGGGTLTLNNNTFGGDTAEKGNKGAEGIIVSNGGEMVVNGNTFQNNTASGGIFNLQNDTTNVTFTGKNTFESNTGSAIYNWIVGDATTFANGSETVFKSNTANTKDQYGGPNNGGAIWNMEKIAFEEGSSVEFTDNHADGQGGAIYNYSTGTIDFNGAATFSGNTDGNGANDIYNAGTINFGNANEIALTGGIDGSAGTVNVNGVGGISVANALKNQTVNVASELHLDGVDVTGSKINLGSDAVLNTINNAIEDYSAIKLADGSNIKVDANLDLQQMDKFSAGYGKTSIDLNIVEANMMGTATSADGVQLVNNGVKVNTSSAIYEWDDVNKKHLKTGIEGSGKADGKVNISNGESFSDLEMVADGTQSGVKESVVYEMGENEDFDTATIEDANFIVEGNNQSVNVSGTFGIDNKSVVTMNNVVFDGTGSIDTYGQLKINDSEVNVDLNVLGGASLESDPTSYSGTVTIDSLSTGSFDGDTFESTAVLKNSGTVDFKDMTFESGSRIEKDTTAGTLNFNGGDYDLVVTGNNINLKNGADIALIEGSDIDGLALTNDANNGTIDLRNKRIDTLGTTSLGSDLNLLMDVNLNTAKSDTLGTITNNGYGLNLNALELLALGGATEDIQIATPGTNVTLSSDVMNTLHTYYSTVSYDAGTGILSLSGKNPYASADLVGSWGTGNYIKAYSTSDSAGTSVGANLTILDDQVKTNADDIAAAQTAIGGINDDITVASGTYNYIAAGTDVAANLSALDTQAKANADAIAGKTVTVDTSTGVATIKDGATTAEVYTKTAAETIFAEKQAWTSKELGYDTASTDAKTILTAAGFTNQTTGDTDVGLIDAALQLKTEKQNALTAGSGIDITSDVISVKNASLANFDASKVTDSTEVAALFADPTTASDANVLTEKAVVSGITTLFDQKQAWASKELGYDTTSTDAKTILTAAGFTNQTTGDTDVGLVDAVLQLKTDKQDKLVIAADSGLKWNDANQTQLAVKLEANKGLKVSDNGLAIDAGDTMQFSTSGKLDVKYDTNTFTATTTDGLKIASKGIKAGMIDDGAVGFANLATDAVATSITGATNKVATDAAVKAYAEKVVSDAITFNTDNTVTLTVGSNSANVYDTTGTANYVKANAQNADYTALTSGAVDLNSNSTIAQALQTLDSKKASLEKNNTFTGANTFKSDSGISIQNATTPSVSSNLVATQLTIGTDTHDVLQVTVSDTSGDGSALYVKDADIVTNGGFMALDSTGMDRFSADEDGIELKDASGNTTFLADTATGNVQTAGTLSVAGGNFTVDGNGAVAAAGGRFTIDKDGKTIVGNDFAVTDKFTVAAATGNTQIGGDLGVTNKFKVEGATGNTYVVGTFSAADGNFTVDASGNTAVAGTMDIEGDTTIGDKFSVTAADGSFSAAGGNFTVDADGAASVAGGNFTVDKDGNTTAQGNLGVYGTSYLQNTNVNGALAVTGTSWLKNTVVDGALAVSGDSTVGQNFAVAGTSYLHNTFVTGDVDISGTTKTGALTFDGTSYVAAMDQGAAAITNGVVDDQAKRTMATNATVAKTVGNLAALATASNGVTSANDVADAINSLGANVETATGGTFAADGVWTGTVTGTKAVNYAQNVAYNNIVSAVDQVASNVGAVTTAANGNITTTNTVNANLDQLDASIGNRAAIASKNAAVNTGTAANVAAGLKAAGDAIGDADFTTTHYAAGATDASTAIRAVDETVYKLDNEVRDLRKDVNRGFASMAALSALVPNARANGNTQVSVGTGMYSGHTGFALGGFHWFNDNLLMNVGVAYGDGDKSDVIYRAGVTYSW